jgi:hypothetical protein
MSKTMYEAFVSDLVETMMERFQEAETESKEAPEDLFKSGRSLAYFEIKDIIESRLKIYGIEPEQENDE